MAQEVRIHRSLNHPHVVKLFNFFEDSDNVYITLELCARRSLMELHKRRRSVTEPEARYFTHQVGGHFMDQGFFLLRPKLRQAGLEPEPSAFRAGY